ncbi:glycosyl transferase [Pontibacillus salipaludis]|uniref:Glycosyl transferase n=1 Tax=Pontibacillus salipaludis TaxID=1697394 RepID=A0ABQ1Q1N6_9BACI|nr:glycosyl transferase [Pontibacillus salipaludis]
MKDILYIVVPCYNEEEVLLETSKRLEEKLNQLIRMDMISLESRIVFVNDGSKDSTWDMIESLHDSNPLISGINLSKNRGHQNALLAGLLTSKEHADLVISMDADLQDDINAVDEMIEKYYQGCDIVYGVRSAREKDTMFKRFTAQSFYKVMNMLGAKVVYNHADYRLMSKKALEGLENFKEVNLFLRGLVPMLGFKTDIVTYERSERFAGESKYPLKKMFALAFEGITSLSTVPIKMITRLGIGIFFISILMLIYSVGQYFRGETVVGWSSLIVSIWAIGGLILFSIGIIGEYIGKVYLETKNRPRFIIDSFINTTQPKEQTEQDQTRQRV